MDITKKNFNWASQYSYICAFWYIYNLAVVKTTAKPNFFLYTYSGYVELNTYAFVSFDTTSLLMTVIS